MKEIELSAGTIRYRDVGRGPPVVFVHGLLASGTLWDGVVAALAPAHRCIVPDWPLGSHTAPMRPDADLSPPGVAALVAELIAALDLSDVTLVGNDSGGAISQIVAARHADRLGRLVLTNCDALEVFPPAGYGYLQWVSRVPGAMFAMAKALRYVPWVRRLRIAYGALTVRPIPDDVLSRWVAPAARDRRIRRDAAKFLRGVSSRHTLAAADELEYFERPALLVWGADDTFFTVALARRLAARIPDARVETIAGARTFAPLDQPAQVAERIARFIERTQAGAGAGAGAGAADGGPPLDGVGAA